MKLLFLMFLFPCLCSADEYIWKDECNNGQRHLNECSKEMLDFYDSELNRLYSLQMQYLTSDLRKQMLKEAQLAWIEFRDKDCMYVAGERKDSGSLWPAVRYACLAERTKVRVKELGSYLSCRDNGCPY